MGETLVALGAVLLWVSIQVLLWGVMLLVSVFVGRHALSLWSDAREHVAREQVPTWKVAAAVGLVATLCAVTVLSSYMTGSYVLGLLIGMTLVMSLRMGRFVVNRLVGL